MIGNVLGMRIGLLLWRGLHGVYIFELHGVPDRDAVREQPWHEIRIDTAIIDLLWLRGAGRWREPSREEKIAAAKYNEEDI